MKPPKDTGSIKNQLQKGIIRLPYLDMHVAGEPFRLIHSMDFMLPGRTMFEKKERAEETLGRIRKLLMNEPRGYRGMYGGFLLPPQNEGSDCAILFMTGDGYTNMCGHGALAVARALYELSPGRFLPGDNRITADVPAGTIELFCRIQDGYADEVSFINTPSYVCGTDIPLSVPGMKLLHMDIAFAGGFMVYIQARELGVTVCRQEIGHLMELARQIMPCIAPARNECYPGNPDLSMEKCGFCLIFTEPELQSGDEILSRNFTVYGEDLFDLSPTGTGTCGRLALLDYKNKLKEGIRFRNAGVSGDDFTASIAGRTMIGEYSAIIPRICGRAYLTGKGEFLFEKDDPWNADLFQSEVKDALSE